MPQIIVQSEVQKMNDVSDSPQCVICEFVMTQLDNSLKNNATDVSKYFCTFW